MYHITCTHVNLQKFSNGFTTWYGALDVSFHWLNEIANKLNIMSM